MFINYIALLALRYMAWAIARLELNSLCYDSRMNK